MQEPFCLPSSSQEGQAGLTLRPSPLLQSLLLVVLGPWEGVLHWVQINSLDQGLSILSVHQKATEGSLKHTGGWAPTPQVADSLGLRWGLRVCISSKLPGAAAVAGLEPHFESP